MTKSIMSTKCIHYEYKVSNIIIQTIIDLRLRIDLHKCGIYIIFNRNITVNNTVYKKCFRRIKDDSIIASFNIYVRNGVHVYIPS